MKNAYLTPVLLAVTVLIGACSSTSKTTGLLDLTRTEYRMAQSNPKVVTYAPVEMKQASDAMAQAEAAAKDKDSDTNIDKLAYLARQKIALTQEVAKQKSAELEVAASGKERDQLVIDQRTNEANAAKMNADKAKLATQQAQGQTADAQRQAQEAQARAAQLEAQLADLAAKKTERGMVITLGDVLFGTDLARLNADGMRTVQKLADVLKQNPQRTVLVEGFTDSTGPADYNLALSERRATAVQTALQELGVARTRVAIHGYGESHPVASNDNAQNRQLNRRVEIVLSDDSGKVMAR